LTFMTCVLFKIYIHLLIAREQKEIHNLFLMP